MLSPFNKLNLIAVASYSSRRGRPTATTTEKALTSYSKKSTPYMLSVSQLRFDSAGLKLQQEVNTLQP
jgi:hypothetical protein